MALPYLRSWGGGRGRRPWRRHSMTRREVSYSSQWDQASFPSDPRGIRACGSLGHCQCKWTCLYWSPKWKCIRLAGPCFFCVKWRRGMWRKKQLIYWWTGSVSLLQKLCDCTPIKSLIKGYILLMSVTVEEDYIICLSLYFIRYILM